MANLSLGKSAVSDRFWVGSRVVANDFYGGAVEQVVVLIHNFTNNTPGTYLMSEISESGMDSDWFKWTSSFYLDIGGASNNYTDIVTWSGSQCQRARIPYNSDGTYSGWDFYSQINPAYKLEEIYISYNVSFPTGFQSAHGGKLPGLCAQPYPELADWPTASDGALIAPLWKGSNGPESIKWYNRLHWPEGGGPGYPTPDGPYWTGSFTDDDNWHNITIRAVHSTPSQSDGLCEAFIDGVLTDVWPNICTRQIDGIYWDMIRWKLYQNDSSEQSDSTNYYVYADDPILFYFEGESTPGLPIGKVTSSTGRDITEYLPSWPKVHDTSLNIIFSHSWDDDTLGQWQYSEISASWFQWNWYYNLGTWLGGNQNDDSYIVNEDGYKCLRVDNLYNDDGIDSGIDLYAGIPPGQNLEEVYVSYNIKFQNGYQSAHGGKLPGLTSLPYPTLGGPTEPDEGCEIHALYKGSSGPDSIKWYNKLHWPEGNPGWSENWSDGPYWTASFDNGEWHNITLRMVHSTPSQSDGLCEVFLDGYCTDKWPNICTRVEPNLHFDIMRLQIFINDAVEQSDNTEYSIYIDDWYVFNYTGSGELQGKLTSSYSRSLSLPNWPMS